MIPRTFRGLTLHCQNAAICPFATLRAVMLRFIPSEGQIRAARGRSWVRALATISILFAAVTSLRAGITTNDVPPTQVTLPLAAVQPVLLFA